MPDRFTDVRRFDTIDSTNRYLLEAAAAGAPDGVVAVADVQTAGRGRLGRSWVAPPGASLLVSVLLRPRVPPVAGAPRGGRGRSRRDRQRCAPLAGIDVRLKWPNDVVVEDRKLAGILAEASGDAVVVGMGLNVHWRGFPPEIAEIATACNVCSDQPVDRDELLAAWLEALDVRLRDLDGVARDAVACSATLGRRVRVQLSSRAFEGDAIALTADGHLVVRTDDGRDEHVAAGDVVHLRPR